MQRAFEVVRQFQVASYDIDLAGIVSNIVYLRWLEDLRLDIFNQFVPFEELIKRGYSPALVHTGIDYKRSIRMFEKVTGRMWLDKIGSTSATLGAEIYVGDHLSASAQQVGVFVDVTSGRATTLPPEIVTKFNGWKARHQERGL